MKLPSFQFYPGDWMKDPNLRRCSQAARGVWIDMLCLMFECEQRGVFATGSRPWQLEEVAAAVGGNADVTLRCINELVAKGVCKVREDGALFSSRIVKDEAARAATRLRVKDYREKHSVTPMKRNCNGHVTPNEDEVEDDCEKEKRVQGEKPEIEILNHLSEASGKSFRPVEANLCLIRARLSEPGVDKEGVIEMINRQCSMWKGDRMEEYLRPKTLFGKENFDGYYASRKLPIQKEKHAYQRNNTQSISRSEGTANEGLAAAFRGVGKV